MGAVYDDLPGHEGYAVEHHGGHVAACSCGWRDDVAPAADDYDAAIERWDDGHANPLLERAVPREVAEAVAGAQRALADLARSRPMAASKVLDELERSLRRLRPSIARPHDDPMSISRRLSQFPRRDGTPHR